mgnify:CR=1 FL=1
MPAIAEMTVDDVEPRAEGARRKFWVLGGPFPVFFTFVEVASWPNVGVGGCLEILGT